MVGIDRDTGKGVARAYAQCDRHGCGKSVVAQRSDPAEEYASAWEVVCALVRLGWSWTARGYTYCTAPLCRRDGAAAQARHAESP